MIDDVFQAWTDIIGMVVNLILSNVITSMFFGTFAIVIITNVIAQIFNRDGSKKE